MHGLSSGRRPARKCASSDSTSAVFFYRDEGLNMKLRERDLDFDGGK
jgi:hypothetical protein